MRFARKPRSYKPRKMRRNTALQVVDGLSVYLVNRTSLAWAGAFYDVRERAKHFKNKLRAVGIELEADEASIYKAITDLPEGPDRTWLLRNLGAIDDYNACLKPDGSEPDFGILSDLFGAETEMAVSAFRAAESRGVYAYRINDIVLIAVGTLTGKDGLSLSPVLGGKKAIVVEKEGVDSTLSALVKAIDGRQTTLNIMLPAPIIAGQRDLTQQQSAIQTFCAIKTTYTSADTTLEAAWLSKIKFIPPTPNEPNLVVGHQKFIASGTVSDSGGFEVIARPAEGGPPTSFTLPPMKPTDSGHICPSPRFIEQYTQAADALIAKESVADDPRMRGLQVMASRVDATRRALGDLHRHNVHVPRTSKEEAGDASESPLVLLAGYDLPRGFDDGFDATFVEHIERFVQDQDRRKSFTFSSASPHVMGRIGLTRYLLSAPGDIRTAPPLAFEIVLDKRMPGGATYSLRMASIEKLAVALAQDAARAALARDQLKTIYRKPQTKIELPSIVIKREFEAAPEGGIDGYYGDAYGIRSVASRRLAAAAELYGQQGGTSARALPLLGLSLGVVDVPTPVQVRAEQLRASIRVSEYVTQENEVASNQEIDAMQARDWNVSTRPLRAPRRTIAVDETTPIQHAVISLLGPTPEGYRCLKQVQLRKADFTAIKRVSSEDAAVYGALGLRDDGDAPYAGAQPVPTVTVPFAGKLAERVVQGFKTMTTRANKVSGIEVAGQVGRFVLKGVDVYIKYLGELTFMELMDRLRRPGVPGMVIYSQREAFAVDASGPLAFPAATAYEQILHVVPDNGKRWVRGATLEEKGAALDPVERDQLIKRMHIYALSLTPDGFTDVIPAGGSTYSPMAGLRAWAARELDLTERVQKHKIEADYAEENNEPKPKPPPAPYTMVMAFIVKRADVANTAPGALLRQVSNSAYAVGLYNFDLPAFDGKDWNRDLLSLITVETSDVTTANDGVTKLPARDVDRGILPRTTPKVDVLPVLAGLVGVRPTDAGTLRPAPHDVDKLFSPEVILETAQAQATLRKLLAVREEKQLDVSDDQIRLDAYWGVVNKGVTPAIMVMGASVAGERAGYLAHGGFKGKAAAGEREFKTSRRTVRTDIVEFAIGLVKQDLGPKMRKAVSTVREVRRETEGKILSLDKVLHEADHAKVAEAEAGVPVEVESAYDFPPDATGVYVGGFLGDNSTFTVKVDGKKLKIVRQSDADEEKAPGSLIVSMMLDRGIEPPTDPTSKEELLAKLVELREALHRDMNIPTERGMLRTPTEERVGEDPEYQAELDEIDFLRQLSRLNPGGRKMRRRERQALMRRNPIQGDDLKVVAKLLAGQLRPERDRAEYEEAVKVLNQLRTEYPPEAWPVSRAVMEQYFPRRTKASSEYDSSVRAERALPHSNLLSLAEDPGPTGVDARFDEEANVFANDELTKRIQTYAELSAPEMDRILKKMQASRTSQFAMQPSTAVYRSASPTGPQRKKRLGVYQVPPAVMQRVGMNELIWLSPVGSPIHRLMVYRRGIHLDTNMVTDDARQIGELVGRALQASLYWLAEKPRRARDVSVFFGRVGDPNLYTLYTPGQALRIETLTNNARKAASGDVNVTQTWGTRDDAQRDYAAYEAAENHFAGTTLAFKKFGEAAPKGVEKGGRPPAVSRPDEEDAEEMIRIGDEDEEGLP